MRAASAGSRSSRNTTALPPRICTTNLAFGVEQMVVAKVNTTNLNIQEALDAAVVSGTWPNWDIPDRLNATEGFQVTAMLCKLVYRCATGFGPRVCPPLDNPTTNVDISLVECSSRPAPLTYVPVRTDDPTSGNVEVRWFHEMLDLQEYQNDPQDNSPVNNWDHYGYFAGNGAGVKSANYHYTDVIYHAYLPFVSKTWNDGTPYKIVANTHTSKYTDTDVPACHGTSGSGTFIQGNSGLLGPMPFGYTANDEDRLCDRFSDTRKNESHTGFVNAPITLKLFQSIPASDK
jgi:hypothetical protein